MGVLDEHVAIVTGGGRGVGRGIALALSGAGAKVDICGHTPETLAAVRKEIEGGGREVLDVATDITSAAEREHLIGGEAPQQ